MIFRPTVLRLAILACTAIAAAPVLAASSNASDGTQANRPAQDTSTAIVQLAGDPLSTYVKTHPAQGKKIDFNNSGVKSYRAQLSKLRNDYKAWLHANVPQAKVTGEFDISLNAVSVQLNGASLGQVSATPMVSTAQYEGLYYPTATDPDSALISAPQAWAQNGGSANAGAGVKVAIVDTGIDITNPCFSDAGYPAQQTLGDQHYTNNKVIVAKVFSNRTPQQGYTAAPVQDHGTHVAGTVACNFGTPAPVNGVTTYAMSGVAPRALLGSYNIFPGQLANARSEDILNALEAAYQDGFDVANMSLGGGSHGFQDLLTVAVDNLDQANMVVAVAAGNSGPGLNTVESPGMAARALTAGAASVPHLVATPVTVNGNTYPAATGDFATVSADLTAPLAPVMSGTALTNACSALPGNYSGQIVLVSRGTCAFTVKIRNAQAAGAAAVLVANNVAGDPAGMASDGTANQPTIPAYMVSVDAGQTLKALPGAATTISASPTYIQTANADLMAGFSSQGPTDVSFRVKPDVVAPGVNVLSSIPAAYCAAPPCFAFFQGTSMATPHLAGSAAIVRQQHPGWTAAQIRSAVVNTADRGVLRNFTTGALESNVNIEGAGRENLASAVNAQVGLDPVSVSFGAVPNGSGMSRSSTMTVTNLTGGSLTLSLAVNGSAASLYSLSTSSLTLAAGGSGTVTVTMSAPQGVAPGGYQAWLDLANGSTNVAHAALYTLFK